MMRILVALLLLWSGCHSPVDELSTPRELLIPVLVDIHVAKAAVQNAAPAIRDSLYLEYFNQICNLHRLNVDSVQQDLDILTRHPARMEGYYAEVVEILDSLSVRGNLED